MLLISPTKHVTCRGKCVTEEEGEGGREGSIPNGRKVHPVPLRSMDLDSKQTSTGGGDRVGADVFHVITILNKAGWSPNCAERFVPAGPTPTQ